MLKIDGQPRSVGVFFSEKKRRQFKGLELSYGAINLGSNAFSWAWSCFGSKKPETISNLVKNLISGRRSWFPSSEIWSLAERGWPSILNSAVLSFLLLFLHVELGRGVLMRSRKPLNRHSALRSRTITNKWNYTGTINNLAALACSSIRPFPAMGEA